jgi:hypothetical protein
VVYDVTSEQAHWGNRQQQWQYLLLAVLSRNAYDKLQHLRLLAGIGASQPAPWRTHVFQVQQLLSCISILSQLVCTASS